MKVEFTIRVTVEADSSHGQAHGVQEAYDALAEHLDSPESPIMGWGSETYAVDGGEPQDTEDLFLKGGLDEKVNDPVFQGGLQDGGGPPPSYLDGEEGEEG